MYVKAVFVNKVFSYFWKKTSAIIFVISENLLNVVVNLSVFFNQKF